MTPYYDAHGISVWNADARALPLPDESVDCVVTSPPYNVGMPYEGVSDTLHPDDYAARARERLGFYWSDVEVSR